MVIKSLYGKYFQKSKSFLYPALGIKKNSEFSPINTYMAINDVIELDDMKLVCIFELNHSEKFLEFERNMLIENPLFFQKIETEDSLIYIFDFEIYKADWFSFILGKYSKLSITLKRAIKAYYGPNSQEYGYMDSYLYPKEYFNEYAELLDVSVESLSKIGELCDACDMDKETLKIPEKYIASIKKEL